MVPPLVDARGLPFVLAEVKNDCAIAEYGGRLRCMWADSVYGAVCSVADGCRKDAAGHGKSKAEEASF